MGKSSAAIIIIAITTLVWAGFLASKSDGAAPAVNSGIEITTKPAERTENGWTKGNKEAKGELVEFADFECPACAQYEPVLNQLLNDVPELKLTYKHYPLPQHTRAPAAAVAAEAAGEQGKFAEMASILYRKQSEWQTKENNEVFIEYAKSLNLDIDKFKSDLERSDLKLRVENNNNEAKSRNLNATPTFFLNGKEFQFSNSYEEVVARIKEAIK